MITFAKAQFASLVASVCDYLFTVICVELLGFWYLAGSSMGTIAGGLTNFSIGRRWVFKKQGTERDIQLIRYFLVWTGYLLLATFGVYLLTHFGKFPYIVSKLSVTLFLAVAYNYPLQKRFVFR